MKQMEDTTVVAHWYGTQVEAWNGLGTQHGIMAGPAATQTSAVRYLGIL